MGKRTRRVFSPAFKREAVARFSAAELGIAANRLGTWRLEQDLSRWMQC